ncbi:MAG: hypothetical protein GY812_08790 [Actinomycetia bacterium]|nr:hypothetical protein [Actinomycetes bacterium]
MVGKRWTAALVACCLAGAGACSGAGDVEAVQPVPESRPGEEASPRRVDSRAGPAPTTTQPDGRRRAVRTELDDLFARYDIAVAAIAADAGALQDPDNPAVARWHAVTVAGSELDTYVRSHLGTEYHDNRRWMAPDDAGVVRRVAVLDIEDLGDGRVRFEHCVYSPFHWVDVDTGEKLDDVPFTNNGHGEAIRTDDGRLRVSDLVESVEDERPLGAGVGDPCPAQVTQALKREAETLEDGP